MLFLAYTGLRWGEATGLRVKCTNIPDRRANIEENAVWPNGRLEIGDPKPHERRLVAYPEFLVDALEEATKDKKPGDYVWGDGETPLPPSKSRRGWFVGAVRRCQAADPTFPYITPHDLRHTAASLAISAGANVKVVQRMLGHKSAAMTLDKYADIFPDDLDVVTTALSLARDNELL